MSTAKVEVGYELYRKTSNQPEKYDAAGQADQALEDALRDSDTTKEVDSYGDVDQQTAALHDYVQSVPFDFPVLRHVIAFDHKQDSRWDPQLGRWIEVIQGASIIYPVVEPDEDPMAAELYLEVKTKNARS